MSEMIVTEKLYHADVHLRRARARVLKIERNEVVLSATPFFPEGGGQVADVGTIGPLRVVDVQKRGGVVVCRPGLPTVSVNTEVVHVVEGEGAPGLAVGDEVECVVDDVRRRGCMAHHGATHIFMAARDKQLGADSAFTTGCRIEPTYARIDLRTEIKLSGGVLDDLVARVNEWIATDASVAMNAVPGVPEMFIWDATGLDQALVQPCGGTHYERLGAIGRVRLQRRREGRNLERIYIYAGGEERPTSGSVM